MNLGTNYLNISERSSISEVQLNDCCFPFPYIIKLKTEVETFTSLLFLFIGDVTAL
jgi:hypothetical protein